MELYTLRNFLAVAKEGNITRAAEILRLSQPALSRQMMSLEEDLGTALLIRGKRTVSLTADGMLLREMAGELIALAEKTERTLRDGRGQTIRGTVDIGTGETDGIRLIARIVQNLRQTHPYVRFRFFSGEAGYVTERLDKGLLDFGLVYGNIDRNKYEALALPIRDVWGVLMWKGSPLASQETVSRQDLWDKPLILDHQSLETGMLKEILGRDPDELNIAATFNLVLNASKMVACRVGYLVTLENLIDVGTDSSLCFRRLDPPLVYEMSMIWRKGLLLSPAADLFLRGVREACQEDTSQRYSD